MFMKHPQIAPARVSGLLKAAEAAARAIPPAFPLAATVAVNPFLGQTHEDLATASARLARVAGIRLTRPRADLCRGSRVGRDHRGRPRRSAHRIALAAEARTTLARSRPRLAQGERGAAAPCPRVAALAAEATGTDWPALIAALLRAVGRRAFRPGPGAVVARPGTERLYRLAGMGGRMT